MHRQCFSWGVVFLTVAQICSASLTDEQRSAIDRLTGAKGSCTAAEDVYRVAFPRTDVKVQVDGWTMHPFMGLTSWAAFISAERGQAMVMGDLTLFEDEVNPVMTVLLDNGLEVTALHNHFVHDSPRVMFMHIGGVGTVEALATGVRKALDKVAEIRRANPQPSNSFAGKPIPEKSSITPGAIENILGVKGQAAEGMYKVSVGRKATAHGLPVSNQMGVNTWAAFAGSDENAFVDGDFAMLRSEVQGVLKSLRGSGINIVAIHNHMTQEEPQFVFLHYWGKGSAAELAKAVKAALDTQGR